MKNPKRLFVLHGFETGNVIQELPKHWRITKTSGASRAEVFDVRKKECRVFLTAAAAEDARDEAELKHWTEVRQGLGEDAAIEHIEYADERIAALTPARQW